VLLADWRVRQCLLFYRFPKTKLIVGKGWPFSLSAAERYPSARTAWLKTAIAKVQAPGSSKKASSAHQ
jgi:hypothetical protein